MHAGMIGCLIHRRKCFQTDRPDNVQLNQCVSDSNYKLRDLKATIQSSFQFCIKRFRKAPRDSQL